jgi:uncharacterized protein (DUF885 family)
MNLRIRNVLSVLFVFALMACQPGDEAQEPQAPSPQADAPAQEPSPAEADADLSGNEDFDALTRTLIEEFLDHNPEWAVRQGRYENAGVVTIPDQAHRRRTAEFVEHAMARLEAFDRDRLPPAQRTEYDLLHNRLASTLWYQETFRGWEWMPSRYNVAGSLSVLLNTDFAPLDERLDLIAERLEQVPAYYQAARDNIDRPTLEHTELAIGQNRGAMGVFDDIADAAADFDGERRDRMEARLDTARAAVTEWIDWLETLQQELEADNGARPFRIGESLYEQKFAYDIQSDFSAAELYERALAEKERLHAEMKDMATELWPRYFPDEPAPEEGLERIARLIDHLSDRHVALEDFVDEIRRQIPELEAFVREHDLVDQDPDKPLVVRETPEYMRGTGAIASVSAPGPFNPVAETYYNVTPLEYYGEELAASYLREYNHWILQILNIHEAIPGHYTQLLHANRSPSLVKSLFGNGAMIEGWAVYAERMMLEEGWGDFEQELWLMHGKWLLRVVFNTILDYAVHVKGMERDEAIRLMREEAFQEESEATQKWRRITLSQVQLTSYFAGYAEIYDLRERIKAEQGDDFDLKAFHNEFLSYGSAPVSTIAELMRGE